MRTIVFPYVSKENSHVSTQPPLTTAAKVLDMAGGKEGFSSTPWVLEIEHQEIAGAELSAWNIQCKTIAGVAFLIPPRFIAYDPLSHCVCHYVYAAKEKKLSRFPHRVVRTSDGELLYDGAGFREELQKNFFNPTQFDWQRVAPPSPESKEGRAEKNLREALKCYPPVSEEVCDALQNIAQEWLQEEDPKKEKLQLLAAAAKSTVGENLQSSQADDAMIDQSLATPTMLTTQSEKSAQIWKIKFHSHSPAYQEVHDQITSPLLAGEKALICPVLELALDILLEESPDIHFYIQQLQEILGIENTQPTGPSQAPESTQTHQSETSAVQLSLSLAAQSVKGCLYAKNINKLYSHQLDAMDQGERPTIGAIHDFFSQLLWYLLIAACQAAGVAQPMEVPTQRLDAWLEQLPIGTDTQEALFKNRQEFLTETQKSLEEKISAEEHNLIGCFVRAHLHKTGKLFNLSWTARSKYDDWLTRYWQNQQTPRDLDILQQCVTWIRDTLIFSGLADYTDEMANFDFRETLNEFCFELMLQILSRALDDLGRGVYDTRLHKQKIADLEPFLLWCCQYAKFYQRCRDFFERAQFVSMLENILPWDLLDEEDLTICRQQLGPYVADGLQIRIHVAQVLRADQITAVSQAQWIDDFSQEYIFASIVKMVYQPNKIRLLNLIPWRGLTAKPQQILAVLNAMRTDTWQPLQCENYFQQLLENRCFMSALSRSEQYIASCFYLNYAEQQLLLAWDRGHDKQLHADAEVFQARIDNITGGLLTTSRYSLANFPNMLCKVSAQPLQIPIVHIVLPRLFFWQERELFSHAISLMWLAPDKKDVAKILDDFVRLYKRFHALSLKYSEPCFDLSHSIRTIFSTTAQFFQVFSILIVEHKRKFWKIISDEAESALRRELDLQTPHVTRIYEFVEKVADCLQIYEAIAAFDLQPARKFVTQMGVVWSIRNTGMICVFTEFIAFYQLLPAVRKQNDELNFVQLLLSNNCQKSALFIGLDVAEFLSFLNCEIPLPVKQQMHPVLYWRSPLAFSAFSAHIATCNPIDRDLLQTQLQAWIVNAKDFFLFISKLKRTQRNPGDGEKIPVTRESLCFINLFQQDYLLRLMQSFEDFEFMQKALQKLGLPLMTIIQSHWDMVLVLSQMGARAEFAFAACHALEFYQRGHVKQNAADDYEIVQASACHPELCWEKMDVMTRDFLLHGRICARATADLAQDSYISPTPADFARLKIILLQIFCEQDLMTFRIPDIAKGFYKNFLQVLSREENTMKLLLAFSAPQSVKIAQGLLQWLSTWCRQAVIDIALYTTIFIQAMQAHLARDCCADFSNLYHVQMALSYPKWGVFFKPLQDSLRAENDRKMLSESGVSSTLSS